MFSWFLNGNKLYCIKQSNCGGNCMWNEKLSFWTINTQQNLSSIKSNHSCFDRDSLKTSLNICAFQTSKSAEKKNMQSQVWAPTCWAVACFSDTLLNGWVWRSITIVKWSLKWSIRRPASESCLSLSLRQWERNQPYSDLSERDCKEMNKLFSNLQIKQTS